MYVLVYVLMFVLLSSGNEKVKMSDVIHFFSGASKLPTSGFPAPPKICFTDEPGLPRSSTCDISITFPRELGYLNEEEFKAKMDMCLLDSFGFGQV